MKTISRQSSFLAERSRLLAGLLLFFVPLASWADGGISGGIGFATAVLALIGGVVIVSGVATVVIFLRYRSRRVWFLFPVYVACATGGLYGSQFSYPLAVIAGAVLICVLVTIWLLASLKNN
jgi:hypothetical protein